MPKTTKVWWSKLKAIEDEDLRIRSGIDEYTVTRYADAIEAGDKLPPPIVDKKTMEVVDGEHTWQALGLVHRRKQGRRTKTDFKVDVVLKSFRSKAGRFEFAMENNSKHGRQLSAYDMGLCVVRAQKLGLDKPRIKHALSINERRWGMIVKHKLASRRATGETVVVKHVLAHKAAQPITDRLMEVNRRSGGPGQLFNIQQLIDLIEGRGFDWGDPTLYEKAKELHQLLGQGLKSHRPRKTRKKAS